MQNIWFQSALWMALALLAALGSLWDNNLSRAI